MSSLWPPVSGGPAAAGRSMTIRKTQPTDSRRNCRSKRSSPWLRTTRSAIDLTSLRRSVRDPVTQWSRPQCRWHSVGAASRLAALLLLKYCPVFSVVASGQPGASPPSVRHRHCKRDHRGPVRSAGGIRPALHPAWLRYSSLKYCPVFSVVASGQPGASPPSVRHRHCKRDHRGPVRSAGGIRPALHPAWLRYSSLKYCPVFSVVRVWPTGRLTALGASPSLQTGPLRFRPKNKKRAKTPTHCPSLGT